MTKLTKKKKQLLELVNPENTYSLEEAMNIFQTVKSNKFDESVDIALRLGIDPGKSEEVLPDLMLVDGGKGQLSATLEELKKTKIMFVKILIYYMTKNVLQKVD